MKINNLSNYKALTLIEALIWFAIFAAVIAGVFALYSNSRDSNNAATVNKELSTIFSQVENLYATESTSTLNTGMARQLGVFPTSIKSANVVNQAGDINVTMYNVFGGTIAVDGVPPSGFTATYTKVPKGSVCSSIVRSQQSVGWNDINDKALTYDSGYTISKVGALCGTNGSGTINLKFARTGS